MKEFSKIYRNIKDRRKELGLSPSDLAEKTGYADKGMISRIESGKVDLPLSKVIEFASALRMSPEELMGEVEPQTDIKREELITIYENLSQEEQVQLLKIAKTYLPDR